jgi:hypothetical protein
MKKVTCGLCGRRRPRSRMCMNAFRMVGSVVAGSLMGIREIRTPACGAPSCLAAVERQKAQVLRKMLGDVHLRRLLYVTEVRG